MIGDDTRAERHERGSVEVNRTDRARSLEALHDAESSAGTASIGRETNWLSTLQQTLDELQAALDGQLGHSSATDGLYADVERDAPRLSNQVRRIREGYRTLLEQLGALRSEVDRDGVSASDVARLRSRLAVVATELRNVRSQEAELLYEACMVDIGVGD